MQLVDSKRLDRIHNILVKRGETIAVAESVTTGLLQLALAQAEFANEFYQGGINAYNLGRKCRHLKVEPILAEACNCVSQKVSEQMALNACGLFTSDWGIGITGYATPVPESGHKIFAYLSIAHKGEVLASGKMSPPKEEAFDIQLKYVKQLLKTGERTEIKNLSSCLVV